jgi:hypothetical protein
MSSESSKTRQIDRPATGTAGQDWNLQEKMELKDDKKRYNSIRVSCNKCMNFITYTFQRLIRHLVIQSPMDVKIPWKNQDAQVIADIMSLVCTWLTKTSLVNCL